MRFYNGHEIVILFHHHQRRHAHSLRLRLFLASLIRPVFSCLAICSKYYGSMEVRKKNYDRAIICGKELQLYCKIYLSILRTG